MATTTNDDLTVEALEQQEAQLVFESFDVEDAYKLGSLLYEDGAREDGAYAVRIELDGLIAFQAFMAGTGAANEDWLNRKCATVHKTGHCSLRAFLQKRDNGVSEDWQDDEKTYACYGGGFPLVVAGELRGVIAISGLPHFDDHRRLTETIASYLDGRGW